MTMVTKALARQQLIDEQELESVDFQQRAWGVQCQALRRSDKVRCRNWAIRGGYVCRKHGGALPPVRASATARLKSLKLRAIRVLIDGLDSPDEKVRMQSMRLTFRLMGMGFGWATKEDDEPGYKNRALVAARKALNSGESTDSEIEKLLNQAQSTEDDA